jgi:molybdopterin converting factor small subunit
MTKQIAVVAYGSLAQRLRIPAAQPQPRYLAACRPLGQVLGALGLTGDDIQLAMINHRAVDLAQTVRPGDRIALFPKEYPIFADWHAYRSP